MYIVPTFGLSFTNSCSIYSIGGYGAKDSQKCYACLFGFHPIKIFNALTILSLLRILSLFNLYYLLYVSLVEISCSKVRVRS